MSTTMTVSEARAGLPRILDRVTEGDEIVITRHGRPVAVVVSPAALRTRRLDAADADVAKIRSALAAGRDPARGVEGGLTAARADELAADVRADRDAHR